MKNGGYKRDRADLPPELISSILLRLHIVEILNNAQKVCRSWRRVCQDPSMWTKIEMRIPKNFDVWKDMCRHVFDLDAMCRHAVDLSRGGLLEIYIEFFGSDSLLTYIADRSSKLRRLGAIDGGIITSFGIFKAAVKLPLLEELEVTDSFISGDHLKVVGKSCPKLRTLMIRQLKLNRSRYLDCDDEIALAIAETMPGLRHLQLLRNGLSDAGLNSILDNCPKLEHLDIRQCFNVNLVGDWKKQCYDRIKVLRHPNDSIHEYDAVNSNTEDEVHEYDDVNSDTDDKEDEEEGYDYSYEEGYDYSYDSDEYVSNMAGDVHYHSYSYYD
ncbi:unnamed protein product [Arabidopsis lyrata]|uniref:Predicted protein n=1 Tax=Arabidopsis lyrata subsp. lyrata TaxID=81972 RepID=D7MNP7_ARALL|nr:putative F-box/LRR-repeat protein 9 isoform X2 [Arabidopsis lyrata subsp. lyrata]EFH40229.1 predicted protein [Arabidopsis lyrata subsp. lyrata]CAH8278994.1 unnamed protein product [Arabidopsis lyrata]|eukprot:XP_002863970.1 putative F-box/LRR-repeat protein 9 isoform X2 [Arabidopsis lyrata subsp. lyrata]